MAMMNSQMRRDRCRDPAGPMASMSTGANRFISPITVAPISTAPAIVPAAQACDAPPACSTSTPGMIREKKEAASMTPAAKPSSTLWVCTPGFLKNSSGTAPTAVIMPAARLPSAPAATGERDSIISLV